MRRIKQVTSALHLVTINLSIIYITVDLHLNSNPYIFLDKNSLKNLSNPIFSLLFGFQLRFYSYAYFICAANSSTIIDDVTKLVMSIIFITNL